MQAAQTVGGVADDPEEAAGVVEVGVVGVLSPLLRGEAVAEWVPVAEMVEEEVSGVGLERGGAVRAVGDDAFAWVGGERGDQRVVTRLRFELRHLRRKRVTVVRGRAHTLRGFLLVEAGVGSIERGRNGRAKERWWGRYRSRERNRRSSQRNGGRRDDLGVLRRRDDRESGGARWVGGV